MYKMLSQYKLRYVQIFQRPHHVFYKGKILDINPDCLCLQTYDPDGNEYGKVLIALSAISDVVVSHPDLEKLALKVQYAGSPSPLEPEAVER